MTESQQLQVTEAAVVTVGKERTRLRRRATPAATPVTDAGVAPEHLAGEDRYQMIAERAYFKAEQRGFAPGKELDDWLAAELEVDALLGSPEER